MRTLLVLTLFLSFTLIGNAQKFNKTITYETINLINNEKLSENDLKNKVVVVNLWGTWCAPCIKEIPSLNTVQKHFANNSDVVFIALTIPDLDNEKKVTKFLNKKPFNFMHINPNNVPSFINFKRSISVPKTVIYSKDGKRVKVFGEIDNDTKTIKLQNVISEQLSI